MIIIDEHPEGATVALRIQPKAKRNAILGEHSLALKVTVTAPPEDGKANDAVLELFHKVYRFHRSQLVLLSGHTHRNKVLLVRGVTAKQLSGLIEGLSKV